MTASNPVLEEAQTRLDNGDFAGAERSCRKALRRRPGDAAAAYMLAILCLRKGDAMQSVELIRRALDNALPRTHDVLENLGAAYLAAGAPESAEVALRESAALGGAGPRVLMCLGIALAAQGKQEQARQVLHEAWSLAPESVDAGINLGNVEAALGRIEDALECFRMVLALDPRNVTAWYNIGTLTRDVGHFEEALNAYRQVLSIAPEHVDALNNMGTIRARMGSLDEAIAIYRRGLQLDPKNVHLLCNLAGALRRADLLDDAEQSCREALRARPDFVEAWITLAGIEVDRDRFETAKECYRRALQLAPEDAEVESFYGMLGLALGDFAEPWLHYRARLSRKYLAERVGALDENLPENLDGRIVLILGEQGIGDELFFLRWAPVLKNRGARLRCVCDAKIRSMLQRTGLFEDLRTHADLLPEREFIVAVGDLPLLLAGAAPSFATAALPSPLRLEALPERVSRMQELLARAGKPPFVAVTWRAGTRIIDQRGWRNELLSKEVPIDVLASSFTGFSGTIISLQRNPGEGETPALAAQVSAAVFDASAVNDDLEDMLALLTLIDDYVGVSNTNMHLLAGLGHSARVMVMKTADWRWMATGTGSPWFPGFVLYRRGGDGTWSDSIGRLRSDLRCMARADR